MVGTFFSGSFARSVYGDKSSRMTTRREGGGEGAEEQGKEGGRRVGTERVEGCEKMDLRGRRKKNDWKNREVVLWEER